MNKYINNKTILVGIFLSLFALFPQQIIHASALTDGITQAETAATNAGVSTGSLTDLINKIIVFLFGLIGTIAVIAVIYGGFTYLTSMGDEKKTEHAKKIIIGAVIGIIVLGLAFVLVRTVIGIFVTP